MLEGVSWRGRGEEMPAPGVTPPLPTHTVAQPVTHNSLLFCMLSTPSILVCSLCFHCFCTCHNKCNKRGRILRACVPVPSGFQNGQLNAEYCTMQVACVELNLVYQMWVQRGRSRGKRHMYSLPSHVLDGVLQWLYYHNYFTCKSIVAQLRWSQNANWNFHGSLPPALLESCSLTSAEFVCPLPPSPKLVSLR